MSPYQKAFYAKILEENEIRASYYKKGSTFYALNYKKWKEAAEILIQKGYTVNQVTEMKETFRREYRQDWLKKGYCSRRWKPQNRKTVTGAT